MSQSLATARLPVRSDNRNPYTPGTVLHALVHEALTGEVLFPIGNPIWDERWTATENDGTTPASPEQCSDDCSDDDLGKARRILSRVVTTPHRFDSVELLGQFAADRGTLSLGIFHELRVDSRHKILPQVVRQLLALSAAAAELADTIADSDRDPDATRLDRATQERTMIDSRIGALRARRDVVSGTIRKICCGHPKATKGGVAV